MSLSAVCDNVVFPDHTQLLFFVNSSPEKQYFKNRKMFTNFRTFTIPVRQDFQYNPQHCNLLLISVEIFQTILQCCNKSSVIHQFSANAHHFSAENAINSAQDFIRVQKPCSLIECKYFGQLPVKIYVFTFC